MPKGTGRGARLTGNAYDFRQRGSAVPEEDVPSYEQTRREIMAAFHRMADTGERPDPSQWARMEAGLREGAAEGKAKLDPLPAPVVYYVRVGNRIKIGYSTNLASRVHSVAAEELLGYEPGDRALEKQRHRQFHAYRMTREWFEDCPAIRKHIASLTR